MSHGMCNVNSCQPAASKSSQVSSICCIACLPLLPHQLPVMPSCSRSCCFFPPLQCCSPVLQW
jgi:hypothetical protein